MKRNRCGKAAIFNSDEIKKIRSAFDVPHHRAIFEIALFTGERMGAIVQLKVDDVYSDSLGRIPHEEITFKPGTRKRTKGTSKTRQIVIHPDLKSFLKSYQPPKNGYLFPGRNSFLSEIEHIRYDCVYQYWQEKFRSLGLDHRGFSCHSTRRWFITNLIRNGVDIKTMMQLTGHQSVQVLLGYVQECSDLGKNAIATLSV